MNERVEATIMTNSEYGEKYDEACKAYFKYKETLAPVLKYSIQELRDLTNEEIINCIDSVSISDMVPVSDVSVEIKNENQELSSVIEKTIRYDIHFRMKNPKLSKEDFMVYLFIDFEVQNDYRPKNPSYKVENRMVYYMCREISSQLGIVTQKTNYDDIQKIYSIWVCNENIPKKLQNTMTRYHLIREDIIGCTDNCEVDLDLMEGIIIRRGDDVADEDIFEYLQSVFTSDIPTIRKYVNMDKHPEIEKEVERMDSLGQSIYDRGVSQGISQGISQGEDLLGKLMDYLLSHQLTEEAKMAALDKEARQEMYKKYGIIKEERSQ